MYVKMHAEYYGILRRKRLYRMKCPTGQSCPPSMSVANKLTILIGTFKIGLLSPAILPFNG